MHQLRKAYAFSVFLCAMFVTNCGGGNRVLTAITISPNPAVAKNGTVQLVATGTFSAEPYTVTPLAVNWSQSTCNNLCNDTNPVVVGPITVNNEGLATCAVSFSGTYPVQAVAPTDPNLPPDTQNVPIVKGTTNMSCP